jgi:tRNA (guanine-N7-)-methyltransferase
LACGKGEYTLGLSKQYPNKNFIGLDIKGNRIWKGAKQALDQNIPNVAFLRCQINLITEYFEKGEVDEIWITFPDPQPRDGKAKKRLTHPLFLDRYKAIGKPNLIINLKTDSTLLYEFTKGVIAEHNLTLLQDNANIYSWEARPEELNIRTFYENIWLSEGILIKYLQFQLKND